MLAARLRRLGQGAEVRAGGGGEYSPAQVRAGGGGELGQDTCYLLVNLPLTPNFFLPTTRLRRLGQEAEAS
eukprot:scaffold24697_cov41-Phaeocystis_antarctica.AAC.3